MIEAGMKILVGPTTSLSACMGATIHHVLLMMILSLLFVSNEKWDDCVDDDDDDGDGTPQQDVDQKVRRASCFQGHVALATGNQLLLRSGSHPYDLFTRPVKFAGHSFELFVGRCSHAQSLLS